MLVENSSAQSEQKQTKSASKLIKTKSNKKDDISRLQIWRPPPGTTWSWQLSDDIVQSHKVEMYDVDLFETDKKTIDSLHKKGKKVVCYVSVGSWEDWRPDAHNFPKKALGNEYEGWEGERWLDIRDLKSIGPIIQKRFDLCKSKGFDGIEPDNIDGYDNDSGFPLIYDDQLKFNIWLAKEAHKRGLSIGLKNDPGQVRDLLPYFDWALTEDCFVEEWCQVMLPFIKSKKAVFQAEYVENGVTLDDFCPKSLKMKFSGILKQRELTSWQQNCIKN